MSIFRCLKIILGKDELNPSTLFNPFKHKSWRVFFQNLVYELFWRNWWRDDQKELVKVYQYSVKLEERLKKLETDFAEQAKWIRTK
jgi:hypothetical protein